MHTGVPHWFLEPGRTFLLGPWFTEKHLRCSERRGVPKRGTRGLEELVWRDNLICRNENRPIAFLIQSSARKLGTVLSPGDRQLDSPREGQMVEEDQRLGHLATGVYLGAMELRRCK